MAANGAHLAMDLSVLVDRHRAVARSPDVCLRLTSRPENVRLVRQMLHGVAEALDLEDIDLDDISTAVTEACNNVVLHAYDDGEGVLEVEVYLYPALSELEVLVRDHGMGIQPHIPAAGNRRSLPGIGVPVIQALVQSVKFTGTGRGTEVRMRFVVKSLAPTAIPRRRRERPPLRSLLGSDRRSVSRTR